MLVAMLYYVLRELFGDRFRDYLEPMLSRKHSMLEKRITYLQKQSAKLDAISPYKSPYSKMKRQRKLDCKVEKLARKSAKLETIMHSENFEKDPEEMSTKPEEETGGKWIPKEMSTEPEEEAGGKWIKETDNDITLLPPAYEDIFSPQPPPYESMNPPNTQNMYPVLI